MKPGLSSDNRPESISVDVPATLRHLNILGAALTAFCERLQPRPPEATIQAVELALQEACTNIVGHAYGASESGRIVMEIFIDAPVLHIHLFDNGRSFDASDVPAPSLEEPQEHGYGVFLMQQLMDSVQHLRTDEKNHLHMTKRLDS